MKMPGAGKRTRLISIQRAMTVQDPDSGENVESWGEVARPWAEKSFRAAKEGMTAGGVQAMRVLRFVILWSPRVADVSPLDRIEYPVGSGVLFDITEANEIGFHEGIELFAQARSEAPE